MEQLFENEPCDREKYAFGHETISNLYAYDTFLLPEWCHTDYPVRFSSDKLNLAAECIRQFTKRGYDCWFHVKVYVSVWDVFCNDMMKGDFIRILPFWTWCVDTEAYREMIVMCPWQHVDKLTRPYYVTSHIFNKQKLTNLILHLSQRAENHFYINLTLPECSKFILACLWERGLTDIARDMLNEQILDFPSSMFPFAVEKDGCWELPVKAIPGLPQNLVLPVPKNFVPTTTPTDIVFYLIYNRKLYFEMDDALANMHDNEWAKLQAGKGNLLCNCIQDEMVPIEDENKKFLVISKPFVDENKQLKKELAERM